MVSTCTSAKNVSLDCRVQGTETSLRRRGRHKRQQHAQGYRVAQRNISFVPPASEIMFANMNMSRMAFGARLHSASEWETHAAASTIRRLQKGRALVRHIQHIIGGTRALRCQCVAHAEFSANTFPTSLETMGTAAQLVPVAALRCMSASRLSLCRTHTTDEGSRLRSFWQPSR